MALVTRAAKASAEAVSRAVALALKSSTVAAAAAQRAAVQASPVRRGQRATPVPLTRHGRPNT